MAKIKVSPDLFLTPQTVGNTLDPVEPPCPNLPMSTPYWVICELQDRLTRALESADGAATFREDAWERPTGGGGLAGGGRTRVLRDGALFEQAGINFSHVTGARLPPAATASGRNWPGAVSKPWACRWWSIRTTPTCPLPTPTSASSPPRGTMPNRCGGSAAFDLTPYYGFEEDCVHWHQAARAACEPFGPEVHPRFKRWCDDYFFIKHRNEPRGIGGLFFDDLNDWGFERCFAFCAASAITIYRLICPSWHDGGDVTGNGAGVSALPARALCRIQFGVRPRHPVRSAIRAGAPSRF